ncbi:MAG: hypothetical protein ACXU86_03100 [Archangium sp.]
MRRVVTWLAWALPLWGLWVLLVAPAVSEAELGVGGVAAALSAVVAERLHARGLLRMSPRARWLGLTGRILWRLVLDTGVVLAEVGRRLLGREPRSAFATFSFPAGADDSRSVARRVLATAALSLPPNAYVIEFDEPEGRVLVHQLVPPPRQGEDWGQLL